MINYSDEIVVDITKEDYPKIKSELLDYLSKKSQGSLAEYILDFCDYYSYRVEDVGDIISDDKVLKSLLKQDCIKHNIFKVENPTEKIDEW